MNYVAFQFLFSDSCLYRLGWVLSVEDFVRVEHYNAELFAKVCIKLGEVGIKNFGALDISSLWVDAAAIFNNLLVSLRQTINIRKHVFAAYQWEVIRPFTGRFV